MGACGGSPVLPDCAELLGSLSEAALQDGVLDLAAIEALAQEGLSQSTKEAADVVKATFALTRKAKAGTRPGTLEAFDLCSAALLANCGKPLGELGELVAPQLLPQLLKAIGPTKKPSSEKEGQAKGHQKLECQRLLRCETLNLWLDVLPDQDGKHKELASEARARLESLGFDERALRIAASSRAKGLTAQAWLKLLTDNFAKPCLTATVVRAANADGQLGQLSALAADSAFTDGPEQSQAHSCFEALIAAVLRTFGIGLRLRMAAMLGKMAETLPTLRKSPSRVDASDVARDAETTVRSVLEDLQQHWKRQPLGGLVVVCDLIRVLQGVQDGGKTREQPPARAASSSGRSAGKQKPPARGEEDSSDSDDEALARNQKGGAGSPMLPMGERCALELLRMAVPTKLPPKQSHKVHSVWLKHVIPLVFAAMIQDGVSRKELKASVTTELQKVGARLRPVSRGTLRELAQLAQESELAMFCNRSFLQRQVSRDLDILDLSPAAAAPEHDQKKAAARSMFGEDEDDESDEDGADTHQQAHADAAHSEISRDAAEKLMHFISLCDVNGDGTTSRSELFQVCCQRPDVAAFFGIPERIPKGVDPRELMEAVFQRIDVDDDRRISWQELLSAFEPHELDDALRRAASATQVSGSMFGEEEEDDEEEDEQQMRDTHEDYDDNQDHDHESMENCPRGRSHTTLQSQASRYKSVGEITSWQEEEEEEEEEMEQDMYYENEEEAAFIARDADHMQADGFMGTAMDDRLMLRHDAEHINQVQDMVQSTPADAAVLAAAQYPELADTVALVSHPGQPPTETQASASLPDASMAHGHMLAAESLPMAALATSAVSHQNPPEMMQAMLSDPIAASSCPEPLMAGVATHADRMAIGSLPETPLVLRAIPSDSSTVGKNPQSITGSSVAVTAQTESLPESSTAAEIRQEQPGESNQRRQEQLEDVLACRQTLLSSSDALLQSAVSEEALQNLVRSPSDVLQMTLQSSNSMALPACHTLASKEDSRGLETVLEEAHTIFRTLDRDNSNFVSKIELIVGLKSSELVREFFGLPAQIRQEDAATRRRLEDIFQDIDKDNNKSLTWDELESWIKDNPSMWQCRQSTSLEEASQLQWHCDERSASISEPTKGISQFPGPREAISAAAQMEEIFEASVICSRNALRQAMGSGASMSLTGPQMAEDDLPRWHGELTVQNDIVHQEGANSCRKESLSDGEQQASLARHVAPAISFTDSRTETAHLPTMESTSSAMPAGSIVSSSKSDTQRAQSPGGKLALHSSASRRPSGSAAPITAATVEDAALCGADVDEEIRELRAQLGIQHTCAAGGGAGRSGAAAASDGASARSAAAAAAPASAQMTSRSQSEDTESEISNAAQRAAGSSREPPAASPKQDSSASAAQEICGGSSSSTAAAAVPSATPAATPVAKQVASPTTQPTALPVTDAEDSKMSILYEEIRRLNGRTATLESDNKQLLLHLSNLCSLVVPGESSCQETSANLGASDVQQHLPLEALLATGSDRIFAPPARTTPQQPRSQPRRSVHQDESVQPEASMQHAAPWRDTAQREPLLAPGVFGAPLVNISFGGTPGEQPRMAGPLNESFRPALPLLHSMHMGQSADWSTLPQQSLHPSGPIRHLSPESAAVGAAAPQRTMMPAESAMLAAAQGQSFVHPPHQQALGAQWEPFITSMQQQAPQHSLAHLQAPQQSLAHLQRPPQPFSQTTLDSTLLSSSSIVSTPTPHALELDHQDRRVKLHRTRTSPGSRAAVRSTPDIVAALIAAATRQDASQQQQLEEQSDREWVKSAEASLLTAEMGNEVRTQIGIEVRALASEMRTASWALTNELQSACETFHSAQKSLLRQASMPSFALSAHSDAPSLPEMNSASRGIPTQADWASISNIPGTSAGMRGTGLGGPSMLSSPPSLYDDRPDIVLSQVPSRALQTPPDGPPFLAMNSSLGQTTGFPVEFSALGTSGTGFSATDLPGMGALASIPAVPSPMPRSAFLSSSNRLAPARGSTGRRAAQPAAQPSQPRAAASAQATKPSSGFAGRLRKLDARLESLDERFRGLA